MASSAELLILIKARDQASDTLSKIHRSLGGLSSAFKVAGVAAAAGFGVAAIAIGSFVKEAAEAQRIQAQTVAVLKSTGGAAGLTAKDVGKLADQLARVIPIDDELIQSTENVLLTFTKVGKDMFPQATEAILDMSTALGTDTQSAAIQVGKALQDPIRGITALRRVGVNFSAEQQKVIKALVESGRAGEAQALILKELQTEFGGSARAAGETFAGKMKILGTQIGNVKEAIGMALIPVLSRGATALANFIGEHQDDIERLATALGDRLAGAVEGLTNFLDRHKQTIAAFFETFKVGLKTLRPVFEFVATNKIAMIAAITAIGVAIALALGPVSAAALAIVGIIALVGFMRQNWDEIKAKTIEIWTSINAFMDEHLGWLKKLVIDTFNAIKTAIEDRLRVIRDVIDIAVALFKGDWGAAWDGVKALARDALKLVYDDVVNRLKLINDLFGGLPGRLVAALGDLGGAIGRAIGNAMVDAVNAVLEGLRKIDRALPEFLTPWGVPANLPHIGGGPDTGAGRPLETLLGFRHGGMVPGPLGASQLAVVHGGERITPAGRDGGNGAQTVVFYGATLVFQGDPREALAAWGLSV